MMYKTTLQFNSCSLISSSPNVPSTCLQNWKLLRYVYVAGRLETPAVCKRTELRQAVCKRPSPFGNGLGRLRTD